MGLKTRKNQPFATITKDSTIQGENIVFVKGGSTVIGDKWVHFNDLKIDLKSLISSFISMQARRIFNVKNGILFVVITLNKDNDLEVIPSISLNQKIVGNVKVFSSLSGKLPLMLVKLTQDGSDDLSSIKTITSNDIETYKGYGNFTLMGPRGETGPAGDKGSPGLIGHYGITGFIGAQGAEGHPGETGACGSIGETGVYGLPGVSIPRYVNVRPIDPEADFTAIPLSGEEYLEVQFTNTTTGEWTNLLWDFGDGSTSTEENPSHVYTSIGTYTVTLYAYGVAKDSKEIKYSYISVIGDPYIIIDLKNSSIPEWVSLADELVSNIINSEDSREDPEEIIIQNSEGSPAVLGGFGNSVNDTIDGIQDQVDI